MEPGFRLYMHSLISGLPVPAGKPEAERPVFPLHGFE